MIGVSLVKIWSFDKALNSSAVTTALFPKACLPASVTQPRKFFPASVGVFANSSPVPSLTFAPTKPLGL